MYNVKYREQKEWFMESKEKKYARGKHPNTLTSLKQSARNGGRPCQFNARKKTRSITMTDEGWEGVKLAAKEYGCKTLSEFLEMLGRGEVKISA